MTDSPTLRLPLPAFIISTPEELRDQRRKGAIYRLRRADLVLAEKPGALSKEQARSVAARMSAWPDRWPEENTALREHSGPPTACRPACGDHPEALRPPGSKARGPGSRSDPLAQTMRSKDHA